LFSFLLELTQTLILISTLLMCLLNRLTILFFTRLLSFQVACLVSGASDIEPDAPPRCQGGSRIFLKKNLHPRGLHRL
jgi:hypothetical protein